jgi:hypothetical protein
MVGFANLGLIKIMKIFSSFPFCTTLPIRENGGKEYGYTFSDNKNEMNLLPCLMDLVSRPYVLVPDDMASKQTGIHPKFPT